MLERLLDALLDELMPRIPRHLLEPRLLLDLRPACRSGLFQGSLVGVRHRCSSRRRRHQCIAADEDRSDNADGKCGDQLRHDRALLD